MKREQLLKWLSLLFYRFGNSNYHIQKYIYKSAQEKRVDVWRKDGAETTLRYEYDNLDNKSIVFDLGGFDGQWASDIYGRYCCTIYVFEPVKEYYYSIKKRFRNNPSVLVFNFGLAERTYHTNISVDQNSSSMYKTGAKVEEIVLRTAHDFMVENNIEKIHLAKVNIEGGEYDLLEHLIKNGLIKCIENIQIQFHDFVPHAMERMQAIQQELRKTHNLTYQYLFVWENWKIK